MNDESAREVAALLDCPFCGKPPNIGPWDDAIDQSDTCPTAIECSSDLYDCKANPSVCAFDREDAIAQWNQRAECVWQQDGDAESDYYATGCGKYFSLNDGTPSDNGMKHCAYCGGKLVEMPYEDDDA